VTATTERIRAWDSPTRIFHWALAVLVVFSYATGKVGGQWMEWHLKSGYAVLALLIFRLAWGIVGSHTARFANFVSGPRAAFTYARAILGGRPPLTVGHNPLGAWMVVLLLALLAAQAASGLFADDEIATQGPLAAKVSNALVERMSSFHYYNGWTIVAAVSLHVLAVAAYQWGLKVDLLGPMIHGWRTVPPGLRPANPARASAGLAAVLLAVAAALVYWLVVIFPRG